MSGTVYDYTPFNNQVKDAVWEDHHSPTLLLLVENCKHMYDFLETNKEGYAVVHCNAGKGRTGTLICCYLMFCGFADSAEHAITYYNGKRFKNGDGVTQPSQIRYVFYFEKLIFGEVISPIRVVLGQIEFFSLPAVKNNFRI